MSSGENPRPKDDVRQMLAEIYELGQARKEHRAIGAPQVGIFWVVNGKPFVFGAPLNEAEPWGEFKNYKEDHIHLWTFLQRNGLVPCDSEYEDHPRGRVVYNTKNDSFMFFADRCILKDKSMVEHLLAELHLPSTTNTESDPHYKCKKCGG
jgi:hypothetical protein